MPRTAGVLKTLWADDSAADRRLFKHVMSCCDCSLDVTFVSSGEAALEYLTARSEEMPAIVILDLNMPGMTGIEVLREIRHSARTADLRVVIFTTSDSDVDAENCRRERADLFLTKPFDAEGLFSSLRIIESFEPYGE